MNRILSKNQNIENSTNKRHRKEKRFKSLCLGAVIVAILFLIILLSSLAYKGFSGFTKTTIQIPIYFNEEIIDPENTRDIAVINKASFRKIFKQSLLQKFPEAKDNRKMYRNISKVFSRGSPYLLKNMVLDDISLIGKTINVDLISSSTIDQLRKNNINIKVQESDRPVSDATLKIYDKLNTEGVIKKRLNFSFFKYGDSRNPEEAGILGALLGSMFTLIITLLLSFPIGVLTAIYLEEFAPKNKFTYFIEININNLAAVPSIVFGLLGLAIFLNFFGLPRSVPLTGGLVLTLMTLPTVIISSRASLKAVPPTIREAALGLGASKLQAVFNHVVPSAAPGMFTGTIIGMARALGETAPLLLMGMVAFIVEVPTSIFDPATVLPAQIYLWADSPERGFVEKTSAAIIVLVLFLIIMNSLAIWLRRKFEVRW
tara:strand:+ start:4863 stop:6152 length:1290 start_codon:yes stop_codon:yes gene_type:complete